jgi:hypothetical protein
MATKKATVASTEAGIMQPLNEGEITQIQSKLISLLSVDDLYDELENADLVSKAKDLIKGKKIDNQVDAFLAIHHEALDANDDRMAQVLNIEPWDVRDRLKDLGYIFPDGA